MAGIGAIGYNIGVGLGEFASRSGAVPAVANLAEKGAAGAVGVAGKSISSATKVTFGIAEKMMVGMIILICIILLFVGLSLLVNEYWKSGGLMTLFGLGGVVGAMYWMRNPATNSILGGDDDTYESDPVVEMMSKDDEDFEELEGDIDYIEHDQKTKKKVHFSPETPYTGSHEDTMLNDLNRVISVLEGESGDLEEIKKSIEDCGTETESVMKAVIETIEKSLEKKDSLKSSYEKLNDEDKQEVKYLLEEIRKLSNEVKEKSHDIDGKLLELIESL